MKGFIQALLACALALTLCACTSTQQPYTVEHHGVVYTVDRPAGTVHDGTHTYHFTLEGQSDRYTLEITYPNGSTYWWTKTGYAGYGGWSDDYSEHTYAAGDDLCQVLETGIPKARDLTKFPLLLVLLATGLVSAAFPRQLWYLRHGWQFKDAEPSEKAIEFNRITGILAAVIAVVLFFVLYIF